MYIAVSDVMQKYDVEMTAEIFFVQPDGFGQCIHRKITFRRETIGFQYI